MLQSDLSAVPEPGMTLLLAAGGVVLFARVRRKLREKTAD
ncbi:MAG: PEP-CTERM sorting domain-containing protein [Planctomyces sp.]